MTDIKLSASDHHARDVQTLEKVRQELSEQLRKEVLEVKAATERSVAQHDPAVDKELAERTTAARETSEQLSQLDQSIEELSELIRKSHEKQIEQAAPTPVYAPSPDLSR